MRRLKLLYFILLVTANTYAQNNPIGNWNTDEFGLPCFNYSGKLPFAAKLKNGTSVKLPSDPWFLLGNYRLTLFTHISGQYELITGERAWGRVNQGDLPNSGANSSSIELLDKSGKQIQSFQLTGINSLAADPDKCQRVFGCGFANYTYTTEKFICKRILSVQPSTNPYNGISAFLTTIIIRNTSGAPISIGYNESVTANFETMQQQRLPPESRKVKYANTVEINEPDKIIKADIRSVISDPIDIQPRGSMSLIEEYPPCLFIKILSAPGRQLLYQQSKKNKNDLNARVELNLLPGEEKSIQFAIGFSYENSFKEIEKKCRMLASGSSNHPEKKVGYHSGGLFGTDWSKKISLFKKEKDSILKREMTWNVYNLEAMAKYSQYYGETKIPQGTIYDYDWGIHASARDNFQHALPLCYYNPALAKSVLKYMMKRITPWGEVRLIEFGNGFANNYSYFTSDQQLYFFLLLSEYLRVTKDYAFLLEKTECYPGKGMPKFTTLQVVENCYKFLKNEIGTGSHGLVRLMNSDWNDAVYYILKEPYNVVLYSGESHMNSAMTITIFDELLPLLKAQLNKPAFASAKLQLNTLLSSMSLFKQGVLDSFMKDLGNRTFSKRMYFAGKVYGENNMFLEPQGFMLQMKEISVEKKKALFDEMKKRLYSGEKLGAREQQTPEFESEEYDKGSRENGGFWYALNGPVIIGVSQFDTKEATKLLKMMSFDNTAKNFPDYWSSYWSASDNMESSLIPTEGLPDQTANYSAQPVYCAHPHAWPLYCYFKIKELQH